MAKVDLKVGCDPKCGSVSQKKPWNSPGEYTPGKDCSAECIPLCDEKSMVALSRVVMKVDVGKDSYKAGFKPWNSMKLSDGLKDITFKDDPETKLEENVLRDLTTKDLLVKSDDGWVGICRSKFMTVENPYRFGVYKKRADRSRGFAIFNEYIPKMHGLTIFNNQSGIELSYDDVRALVSCEALDLGRDELRCKPGKCVSEAADGDRSDGIFFFTEKVARLTSPTPDVSMGILDVLMAKNSDGIYVHPIPGLSIDKRKKIITYLENIKEIKEAPAKRAEANEKRGIEILENLDRSQWMNGFGMLSTALVSAYFGHMLYEKIRDHFRGRVKTSDFKKEVEEIIKNDPKFRVIGRTQEAKAFWLMLDDPDFPHLILDAKSGEGKDMAVLEMIRLQIAGDPSVPERFRDVPVKRISASDFHSGTNLRGQVADKVKEIFQNAEKGPVILYISEIDNVFLGGGSSSGDSESVAKLILDKLEDPLIRKNLTIIGTTSRGDKMIESYPDLKRRFNWPKLSSMKLSQVSEALFGAPRRKFQRWSGVEIGDVQLDLASRLAERYYRSVDGTPRFTAIEHIIKDAMRLAKAEGVSEVTDEHVISATEKRASLSIDRGIIGELRSTPINSLMVDVEIGESVATPLENSELLEVERSLRDGRVLKAMTLGLSDGEVNSLAKDMVRRWSTLSMGERATIMSDGILRGEIIAGEVIPSRWILEQVIDGAKGEHAEGMDGVMTDKKLGIVPKDKDGERGIGEKNRKAIEGQEKGVPVRKGR